MKLVPESLNELQNFDRGGDPKTSLDIGMTPERRFEDLNKKLEPLKIETQWNKDHNMGKGHYYGSITGLKEIIQLGYNTDEAAMAEWDSPGGFWMAEEDGAMIIGDIEDVSHDPGLIIKEIAKMKFGNLENIDKTLQEMKETMKQLEEVKKLIDS